MLVQIITENGQKKIKPLTADAGAGNPVGTIIPMYKKSSPSGYLYCDGSTFDETEYPLLYAYLGSNVLPDYRETAIVGAEQNTTDTIATHDVFTEGQFKDDQLQDHTQRIESSDGYKYRPMELSAAGAGSYTISPTDLVTNNTVAKTITAGRHGDVTRGKRKAVYFYIKATSGLSENAQDNVINTLNEQRSYSTEEHLTGRKWIDGKPTYEKTIDCGALPNNAEKTVAHNLTNVDNFMLITAIAYDTSGNYLPIPYADTYQIGYSIRLMANKTNVVIQTGYNRSTYTKTYVTLEYTKTTD